MSHNSSQGSPKKLDPLVAREKGWNNRTTQQRMPSYDSLRDPNCPMTKTSRFKKHLLHVLHQEETRARGDDDGGGGGLDQGLGWMVKSSTKPGAHSRRDTREMENRVSRNVSTVTGGITMALAGDGRDEEESRVREIDVLKNVVLREEYIRRLEKMVTEVRRKVPEGMGELLDMIRVCSVETVESITKWRKALDKNVPFMWNGVNYLLKMTSDLDFLEEYRSLRHWLGFSVYRNPFIVPLPLEQLPQINSPNRSKSPLRKGMGGGAGNQPQGPNLSEFSSQDFTRLNNPSDSQNNNNKMELYIRLKREEADAPKMMSFIADLDMMRVRNAEKVLIQEEALFMRYVRDLQGRVVPASVAEASILKRVLQDDDQRDARLAATSHPYAAPLADIAGVGRIARDPGELFKPNATDHFQGHDTQPSRSTEVVNMLNKTAKGKIASRKEGGFLHKSRTLGTVGRKKTRLVQSLGAAIDSRTVAMKSELLQFQIKLDELKKKLEVAKAELQHLEGVTANVMATTPPGIAATDPPDTAPESTLGDDNGGVVPPPHASSLVDFKREQVMSLEKEVAAKEAEFRSRSSQVKKREEAFEMFKSKERGKVTKNNALNVERKRRLLAETALDFAEDYDPVMTLEDLAATSIQRLARGHAARVYTKKLRASLYDVAIVIQSLVRGFLVRRRFKKTVELNKKVTKVQALQRGRLGRQKASKALIERQRQQASVHISRYIVGYFGRNRFKLKQRLLEVSGISAHAVGPSQLFPSDVMDLARRIETSLMDPVNHGLPPVVLGLLRVVILLLGGDEITVVLPTGVVGPKSMKYANDINWEDAMRVLRRTSKFLRRLRVVAAGPAARRPRLLTVPEEGLQLYQAYKMDPEWSCNVLRQIGSGSRCACQLLIWVESIVDIKQMQVKFLNDIGGLVPKWVQRHRDFAKKRRDLELVILQKERFITFMSAAIERDLDYDRFNKARHVALQEMEQQREEVKKALARLEADEQEKKELEIREEYQVIEDIKVEMSRLHDEIEKKKSEYIEAEEKARKGNRVQQARLPALLQDLSKLELDYREVRTGLNLRTVIRERNSRLRNEELRYDGSVIIRANAVGEAEGAVAMFGLDQGVLRKAIELNKASSDDEADMGLKRDVDELEILEERLQSAKHKLEETNRTLVEAIDGFEKALKVALEEDKTRENAGLENWNEPTKEELLEDQREDARLAQQESESLNQFVPHDVLQGKDFPDTRPLVICMARDVPSSSKKKIYDQLTHELSGMFIRVSTPVNLGLDIAHMQAVLSTGYSVIVDIDAGLCVNTRRAFIDAMTIVKKALQPNPKIVLLLGDDDNPGIHVLSGEKRHFGVSDEDLNIMQDEGLKRKLQISQECLEVLTSGGQYQTSIEALSKLEKPPSLVYVLVMEAMAVLFSPHQAFRSPAKNMAAAAWFTVKKFTAPYAAFCQRMLIVDKYNIPPLNLLVLEEYLMHSLWPKPHQVLKDTDPVLWYFATWAATIIELAVMFRSGEGPAPVPDRRTPEGLFSGVLKVSSAGTDLAEQDEVAGKGWKSAYAMLMSYVLEDRRVVREGKKLNDGIYTVSVYQAGPRLFFNAYYPKQSSYRHTSILAKEVSMLLAPSSQEPVEPGWEMPPETHQEMCRRLIVLLAVEHISKSYGDIKHLVCRRKLVKLLRQGRRISGHKAVISIFEESKGNLRFATYLPQYSVMISLLVDGKVLNQCMPNLDKELERDMESEDVIKRMVPLLERLAITPSWTAVEMMGLGPPAFLDIKRCPPSSSPAPQKDNTQGFILRIRKHAGAGQKLFRAVKTISRSGLFGIMAFEAGHYGTLRVRIYNHQTCQEQEIRLAPLERVCLLNSANGGSWREWKPELLKRLIRRPALDGAASKNKGKDTDHRRVVVQLDRSVFSKKVRRKGGITLKLTIFLEKRGTELVLCFLVGSKPHTYTKTITWDVLLAAYGVPLPAHKDGSPTNHMTALSELVMKQSQEARKGMYNMVARAAHFDKENDVVVLDGVFFDNLVVRRTDAGGDAFVPNLCVSYKDVAVGEYVSTRRLSVSKEVIPVNDTNDLVDIVFHRRQQLQSIEYAHEIGEKVPVRHFPIPTATSPRPMQATTDESKASSKRPKSSHKSKDKDDTPTTSITVTEQKHCTDLIKPKGEELQIFNQGVKVLHELHHVKTWYANVNLRVFRSYVEMEGSPSGQDGNEVLLQHRLRFVVYRLTTSAYSDVMITGLQEFRQVVGTHFQDLLDPSREEEMILHIAHHRMTVMEGLWSPELDRYEPEGDNFTVLVKHDRSYSIEKETPIHLGGEADLAFNKDKLIIEKKKRGRKILRCARNVQGSLLHITVFEIPIAPEDAPVQQAADVIQAEKLQRERDKKVPPLIPQLRIISFDPKTGHKSVLMPGQAAILENVGGEWSPLLEPMRRIELSRALIDSLVLRAANRDNPFPDIALPWSGDIQTRMLKGVYKRAKDQGLEEVLLSMPGRLIQEHMRVEDLSMMVTVFQVEATSEGDEGTLRINLYCHKIAANVDVMVSRVEQIDIIGRPVSEYTVAGAKEMALKKLIDRIDIQVVQETTDDDTAMVPSTDQTNSKTNKQRQLKVDIFACKGKAWLRAYQNLNPSQKLVRDRPRGHPMVFVPASIKGDVIWRRGVKISQMEVLLTVSTKAKGLPASGGIMFEAYDPITCTNSTLHLGRTELLREVCGKEDLLEGKHLKDTVEGLLYRLRLTRNPVNGIVLEWDVKAMPHIFRQQQQQGGGGGGGGEGSLQTTTA